MDYLDIVHSDERVRRQLDERGENTLDPLGAIDHRYHHRHVHREAQDGRSVDNARHPEPGDAARDGSAAEPLAPEHLDDRHVERLMLMEVAFADIDGQLAAFTAKHGCLSRRKYQRERNSPARAADTRVVEKASHAALFRGISSSRFAGQVWTAV
jgi:hypothetical protein